MINIVLVRVSTSWKVREERDTRKREARIRYQNLKITINSNSILHMHSTNGIEVSEGGPRDIKWIIAVNASMAIATTPAHVTEKSINNAVELPN